MFFSTTVFLVKSHDLIAYLIKDLIDNNVQVDVFIDLAEISDEFNQYPEIALGYRPVIIITQNDEPVIFDNLPEGVLLTSPPWCIEFSENVIRKYFYSHPSLLLFAEYESNYSKYELDTTGLQNKNPDLYNELTVIKRIKF